MTTPDEPPTTPEPPPPPQVVYVYQQAPPPQSSKPVSGGIWDFVFQAWFVVFGIIAFIGVCCGGLLLVGYLGGH